ncbi:hypothetical protein MRBLWO14_002821 [Microbacterium sp. LWO14-1.2]|uniref:hypothetical protein n=1 Tax=Microbacterium sp. LWO14-1.2 TaxID=3135263 RepID=UPI0031396EBC
MPTDLYYFNRATERIEQIANELGEITRTTFNAGAAQRDAEQRFSHMIDRTRRTPEADRMLAIEVQRVRQESEKALEARAIALAGEIPVAENTIKATFDAIRPKRDVSTPAAILLSQERWAAARALLESGRGLTQILETSDIATVLAIEAFAPEYLYAKSPRDRLETPGTELDQVKTSVARQVHKRLSEIAPEPDRVALAKAYRAHAYTDIAWAYAEHLQRRFGGGSASVLEVGVAVHYIRQEYGLDASPAQERRRGNAAASTEASRRLNRLERWGERRTSSLEAALGAAR